MELAIVCSLFAALLAHLIKGEFEGWSPRIIQRLLKHAVARLPKKLRARFHEEWAAHVDEMPTDFSRLIVALSLSFAAGKISAAARRQFRKKLSQRRKRLGRSWLADAVLPSDMSNDLHLNLKEMDEVWIRHHGPRRARWLRHQTVLTVAALHVFGVSVKH